MEGARERSASIAVLTSIPMIGQLVAARAIRDTLFLTEFDAAYLPRVMLAAAALALVAALSVGRLMPAWGPRATAVMLVLTNGAIFLVEALFIDRAPGTVAVVAYLQVSVLGALAVSAFSSVVNERFDPLYAKTVVAHAGTGGALGGVLGGVLALLLAEVFPLATVLFGLGVVSILVALGVWSIGKSTQPERPTPEDTRSGVTTIASDAYLRNIAITIALLGSVGVFVDYAMKAEASLRFTDAEGLLTFFTAFYTGAALLTFLMQAGVAKPLLARVGLGGTMAVLPLSVAFVAGLGALWTQLWSAALARGTQTIVSSSLFRSGYELLYTPVPPRKKRATKAVIDIACNRIGYGLGSVLVIGLVAVTANVAVATSWVLLIAVVSALAAAWLVRRLNDGYVHELATSLKEGSLVLPSDEVLDATTLHTIAETAAAMNRHQLLQSIEELEQGKAAQEAEGRAQYVAQLGDLISREPERVLRVLLDEALDRRFAGAVIEMLASDFYARPAYNALERMGGRITGQLIDSMLAPESSAAVRRRIPRLLRNVDDPRAARGLLAGLDDDEFDVRYRCGHALATLQRAHGDLDIPEELVFDAIARELTADQTVWHKRSQREEVNADIQSEIDALLEEREDRNLQHVFTLLSLTHDRDAVVLSLQALSSSDENLQGTALEYLHNVLPDAVRDALWPRLTERVDRSARSQASSDELLESMRSLMLDRDHRER